MLCLGRKLGERIYIGDNIRITVVRIDSLNHVKIGIEAPIGLTILREELMTAIPQQFKNIDDARMMT